MLNVMGDYIRNDKTQCICGYSSKFPYCDNTHLKMNQEAKEKWNFQIRSYPKHENIKEIVQGIYVISDFISQKTVSVVMEFLENNKNNTIKMKETSPNPSMMANRLINIREHNLGLTDINFNPIFDNLYDVPPIQNIMKYEIGEEFPPHQDSSVYCPLESDWGLVLYINDNYEGGELYYPNKGITYTPKSGDLVIHGATEEFMHGTTPIISGTKYVATSFAFLFEKNKKAFTNNLL